ncbi:DsbA family protein [Staphylococcus hyicus]|uniref:DsbA family protein n=1 Tax=Staphylococcus hyicus TaxID=1284 RepID=UPI003132F9B9
MKKKGIFLICLLGTVVILSLILINQIFSDKNVGATVDKKDLWQYALESKVPIIKNNNSEHQVVVFLDINCPHCKNYYHHEYESIIKPLIDNKKIDYAEIQHPVVNGESKEHAEMSNAIYNALGYSTYQQYKDIAYTSRVSPKEIIDQLQLNSTEKQKVLNYHQSHMNQSYDIDKNHDFKVNEVPTVYIDGKRIDNLKNISDYLK